MALRPHAALCALLLAIATASCAAGPPQFAQMLQQAFADSGKAAAEGYSDYAKRLTFVETSYCDDVTAALYGENWVSNIACKPDADAEAPFRPAMNVGWCYMDSYHADIQLPTPVPNTEVRDSFKATCYFGSDECAGPLANTVVTIQGLALDTTNVVSPVNPVSVPPPSSSCGDGIPDRKRAAAPDASSKAAKKANRKGANGKGTNTKKGHAASADVDAKTAGHGYYDEYDIVVEPTMYYQRISAADNNNAVFSGLATVYDRKHGVIKQGWFNYFYMEPSTDATDYLTFTPADVAAKGLTVMVPYQMSFEFPSGKYGDAGYTQ